LLHRWFDLVYIYATASSWNPILSGNMRTLTFIEYYIYRCI